MSVYIFACRTGWALDRFRARRPQLPGRWTVIVDPADLVRETLDAIQPRYIFFPHWSAIVPRDVVSAYECVCFHMTDLPFGRGGSPLQNLVVRGYTETRLSALRMDAGLDTGPIYGKAPLSIEGPAHEVYRRAADVSLDLMEEIVRSEPTPLPQTGEPVAFTRRKPSDSSLPAGDSVDDIRRFIQMLDADGYPRAFLEHGPWRLELSEAHQEGSRLSARVDFIPALGGEAQ